MDANFVQCVGELPWVGFIVGCILLGITLAWLINRGVTGLVWLQEWRSRRRNKRYERAGLRQKKREARPGYWERAGHLRAKLLARRCRSRLADTLIAQSCLDHGVRLVTRDDDFRHFARLGGLRLAL